MDTKAAQRLMLGTAIMESNLEHLEQIGGPALGCFQMEPTTLADVYVRYLKQQHPELLAYVDGMRTIGFPLSGNICFSPLFACALARVKYWMDPHPLQNNLESLASTWKRVYNTPLGKGTASEFMLKYNTHAKGL